MSTIAKHDAAKGGPAFSRILGGEIKRRRVALGLSQTTAAGPLSRAFMSSVERGRLTPSLSSLLIIARRLNSSAAAILAAVETQLEEHVEHGSVDETAISC
jgi:transcriptional regulator with XRE-family HTH domain